MCLRHTEVDSCQDRVIEFAPEILVHCAWGGVSAAERNDFFIQKANVELSKQVVKLYPFKQIICIGSQDEYGCLSTIVDESHRLSPISEYAKAKISFCDWLKVYSNINNIDWIWIRLFNMYGPGQSSNWLIPSVVSKCLNGEVTMQTTLGEQRYAYLYVDDFSRAIISTFGKKGASGIYNLSSSVDVSLKDIFITIKRLSHSNIKFDFGAIPYRAGQSMIICGDSSKFISTFGRFETVPLEEGLKRLLVSNNG